MPGAIRLLNDFINNLSRLWQETRLDTEIYEITLLSSSENSCVQSWFDRGIDTFLTLRPEAQRALAVSKFCSLIQSSSYSGQTASFLRDLTLSKVSLASSVFSKLPKCKRNFSRERSLPCFWVWWRVFVHWFAGLLDWFFLYISIVFLSC